MPAVSATDGDLDIAYAFLLADVTWGSQGAINYRQQAISKLEAILTHNVHPQGQHLMIGDWPLHDGEQAIAMTTRSSDFMLSHLKAFADATGDARWLKIRDRTYDIMNDIRQRYSAKTGLMPVFWVTSAMVSTRGMQRVIRGAWRWTNCSMASRVPASLIPLNQWARKITRDNPERFADSYGLGGRTLPDHGNNSLAFISALGVSARIDSGNQQWINAIWNDMAGQTITDDDYYGNTLKLLSMVVLSGHWKEP